MLPLLVRRALLAIIANFALSEVCAAAADDPEGSAMLKEAQGAIANYHAGEKPSGAVLRVVYFVPNDRDPLPNYAERLDRILTDVSSFYRDGLRRFGLECEGLPLEKKEGRVLLHLVKGKLPASGYRHESGDQTAEEIRAALAGTMDLDREHVLVLYALCRKEPDGRYVFDAPYYGGGSQRGGLCHAADCELLDPVLLTDTKNKIVYTEHYYPRVEQTVAKFNSMYLGGTAHELGHGLGLPHDFGSPMEKEFGSSLMGTGNLIYRQEIWGGGKPVYLARASALQLASHPLITGSNRGRWESIGENLEEVVFSVEGGGLKIEGKAQGNIPAYGAIAYVWPVNEKSDHRALTCPAVVRDGRFGLKLGGLRPNRYQLKLATLHVNGATVRREFRLSFDAAGTPDVASLNAQWLVDRAESAVMHRKPDAKELLTDAAISAAPTPEAARKLRTLRGAVLPVQPLELGATKEPSVFLSDVVWTEAKVGWGQTARNFFWFDERIQNGVFLTLRGQFYDKGLYAHSPAHYVFPLDGKWKELTVTIGLRDGAQAQGSAVFTVIGDGRELYRSPILRVGSREEVKADVTGVNRLELKTVGGEGHPHNSWAIWADPKVSR
jgi:hypothetical protein